MKEPKVIIAVLHLISALCCAMAALSNLLGHNFGLVALNFVTCVILIITALIYLAKRSK